MTTIVTVDDYIVTQTAEAQPRLRELRAIIRAAVPQATEVISYGMPTYKLGGRRVHFGAAKRHCALYGSATDLFTNELRDFKTLKGTVQFPLNRPIPEKLVRNLVIAKLFDNWANPYNPTSRS
ncbi:MAG: DUF1801 domain-containing protein [Chloroflexota bacterium]|nr:DUF1801 domain-containing protein [Chloroflexota bacterium]